MCPVFNMAAGDPNIYEFDWTERGPVLRSITPPPPSWEVGKKTAVISEDVEPSPPLMSVRAYEESLGRPLYPGEKEWAMKMGRINYRDPYGSKFLPKGDTLLTNIPGRASEWVSSRPDARAKLLVPPSQYDNEVMDNRIEQKVNRFITPEVATPPPKSNEEISKMRVGDRVIYDTGMTYGASNMYDFMRKHASNTVKAWEDSLPAGEWATPAARKVVWDKAMSEAPKMWNDMLAKNLQVEAEEGRLRRSELSAEAQAKRTAATEEGKNKRQAAQLDYDVVRKEIGMIDNEILRTQNNQLLEPAEREKRVKDLEEKRRDLDFHSNVIAYESKGIDLSPAVNYFRTWIAKGYDPNAIADKLLKPDPATKGGGWRPDQVRTAYWLYLRGK